MAKKTAKKAPVKKAGIKKAAVKKKAPVKKAAKKATAKKSIVKKIATKKVAERKTAVKKATVKKVLKKAIKKPAPKKMVVKKTAVKKAVAPKKIVAKKIADPKNTEVKKALAEKLDVKGAAGIVAKEIVSKTSAAVEKAAEFLGKAKEKIEEKLGSFFDEIPVEQKKSKPKTKKGAEIRTASSIEGNSPGVALANAVIEGMQEKKAKNIVVLDLHKIQNRVSDFFVICEAESTTHVDSIANSVEEEVQKKLNEKPFHTEGWENSQWILLDYVNVVVHVFQSEMREFYNLEGMWGDALITEIA